MTDHRDHAVPTEIRDFLIQLAKDDIAACINPEWSTAPTCLSDILQGIDEAAENNVADLRLSTPAQDRLSDCLIELFFHATAHPDIRSTEIYWESLAFAVKAAVVADSILQPWQRLTNMIIRLNPEDGMPPSIKEEIAISIFSAVSWLEHHAYMADVSSLAANQALCAALQSMAASVALELNLGLHQAIQKNIPVTEGMELDSVSASNQKIHDRFGEKSEPYLSLSGIDPFACAGSSIVEPPSDIEAVAASLSDS